MSAVWLATNEAIGREVAIKVMLAHIARDAVALQRFFTEARICGQLRHPGMVDVFDLGQAEDGSPFLVMELLEGQPLETFAARGVRLSPGAILPIVRDVARTLSLAHSHNVVHRDLKPGNLFLHRLSTGTVVAKVLDFGISKIGEDAKNPRATATGVVVGSPAYMSPEQAAGRLEVDARSDVYSLGVILYESLSGRLPFVETNYNALIIDIVTKEPPPLESLVTGLPDAVLALVRDAMKMDRQQRISSAEELASRIDAILATVPPIDAKEVLELVREPVEAHTVRHPSELGAISVSRAWPVGKGSPPWVPIFAGATLALSLAATLFYFFVPAGEHREAAAPIADAALSAEVIPSASVAAEAPAPSVAPTAAAAPSESAAAQPSPSVASTAAPRTSPGAKRHPSTGPTSRPGVKPKAGVFGYD